MKTQWIILSFIFSLLIVCSGCEAIGAIFKAGVWAGIFIVVLIVALILFLFRGGKNK